MSYKETIWSYFLDKIGNNYGVAGLMGNLYAESGLNPKNLQDSYETSLGYTDESYTAAVDSGAYTKSQFVNDSAGYGLAQWTYSSRKQGLYELYKSGGYSSIGSIDLALDYLWYELQNSYPGVLSVLKSATSVRQASDKVLHDFEKPANQSTSVEEYRCSLGETYYNELSGTQTSTFTPRLTSEGMQGAIYWYSGNPFHLAGYGMPNCTTYAWGRFWEISDKTGDGSNKPTLPTSNAGKWWGQVTGYDTGQTPKLGAVICWSDNTGGAGHVAIVEEIADNGDITVSQSGWESDYFWTNTKKKSDGYSYNHYTFQGFIYNPHVTSGGGGGGNIPDVPDDPEPETPIAYYPPKKKRKGYNFVLFNQQRRMNR